jgi:hypothetical protein
MYMVWNPDRRLPKKVHGTETEARVEASRLAAKHPGETFIVLTSIGAYRGVVTVNASPIPSKVYTEGEM